MQSGKRRLPASGHHGKTQYQKAGEIVMLYTRSKYQKENKRKQGANKQDLSSLAGKRIKNKKEKII